MVVQIHVPSGQKAPGPFWTTPPLVPVRVCTFQNWLGPMVWEVVPAATPPLKMETVAVTVGPVDGGCEKTPTT